MSILDHLQRDALPLGNVRSDVIIAFRSTGLVILLISKSSNLVGPKEPL
jgi:hypothetical protein